MIEVRIPDMEESTSEVTVTALLVESGTLVEENQEILEIESDRSNQLVYAPISGKIQWMVKLGDIVSPGGLVANIEAVDAEIIAFPKLKSSQQIPGIDEPQEERRERMSSLRRAISCRLVSSLQETAMLTTFNEIQMAALMQLRKDSQIDFMAKYGIKLGLMSFFIKATVEALKVYPCLNAYIDKDEIVYRNYYDLCVAINTDQGLVTPVIRHCDMLTSYEIEGAIANMSSKAREGTLALSEITGGGFTITNEGSCGSLFSTPIINSPQVGVLGMYKIEKRPIVVEKSVVIADMMYVALSYDHRIVGGKEATGFLVKVKELIEQPKQLLDLS